MNSSSSRSPVSSPGAGEEGEIREPYEVEKAPPSLPSVSGPSVDRHSSSTSRSSTPRIPQHHRRTSEKRRRSESREPQPDSRSFKPRFDPPVPMRRPRVSYADIDQGDARNVFADRERERARDAEGDRHRSKRSRTRSVTPPRGALRGPGRRGGYDDRRWDARDNGRDRREDRGGYQKDTGNGRYDGGRRRSRERSLDSRGTRPAHHDRDKRDAEVRNRDSERPSAPGANGSRANGSSTVNDKPKADVPVEIEEPIDEDKLIEERRKKREALKAKFRGQTTPMLANALGVVHISSKSPDDSGAASANDSLVSTPGEIKSPRTPASPLQEASPDGSFDITKDVNQTVDSAAAEEPSAADYDPTVDMQEDRDRNEQRRHEVSSSAYDEMAPTANDRDILMPDAEPVPVEPETKPSAAAGGDDDFDMFAEGDDDDMFAPEPAVAKNKPRVATTAKAVPIVEAKQLDAGMLDNWDDEDGYYKTIPGELLDGRYRVHVVLGKGMFSNVVRALDMTTKQEVAIKIIRNNETMRKAGMKEIDILRKIREADPDDKRHIVKLERYFEHKSHLCIVFENLSLNLREVLKKSGIRDVGISLRAVRAYAHQLFFGLSLLRKCQILHADLKPDNILVTESQTTLKICDLGSASDITENEITPYLVSRFYRAPEIILGIPYDYAIDMWSIGCTLYELYTGKILFTGRTNNQMLRSIMECRGKFSVKLLKKGTFSGLHFDEMGNFRSLEKDKVTGKDIVRTINFSKPTRELKQRLLSATSGSETEIKELNLFVDLLERCLNLNPEKRCTPNEALKHPFIYRPIGQVGK